MTAVSLCIQRALDSNALREPVFRSVIRSLELPEGSHGLDAGCGPGLQAILLAEAVGPEGRVTGLDIEPALLAYGNTDPKNDGPADRIGFSAGDVGNLPFANETFDWVWSADCIGYPLGELLPVLKELVRVLKPGGRIVLLGWTSQQLLPGYPVLEACLNATCSAYLPYLAGKKPDLNFLRTARWLKEAGLEQVRAITFIGDVQAPLRGDERVALVSLFEMLWGSPGPGTLPPETTSWEDWEAYGRLCDPASPDFILDLPDYYAFFTYTLFQGRVPKGPGTQSVPNE